MLKESPGLLASALEAYYDHSRTASTVCRQLGFAGIALIWVFRIEVGDETRVDPGLLWPAVLIGASLASDLLHYVVGSAVWGIYHRSLECRQQRGNELPVGFNRYANWPMLFFFWIKLALMIPAYTLIVWFLINRVF
jgi:hypothetical protein